MERLLNKQARKTITIQGRKLIITGKVATLQYLGMTPDSAVLDSSFLAVDRTFTRKGYKRARWYGDSGGATVPATTVNAAIYQFSDGGTSPGRPIGFTAVSDTNGDSRNRRVTGTIELSGPFGLFMAYMEEHRPTKSVTFRGPRGKYVAAPTLSAVDFAAID